MRLIDADALKAELLGRIAFPDWVREAVLHIIDNAPTVLHDNYSMGYQDGVKKVLSERPTGEWIIDGHHYKCSRCGKTLAIMFSETDDDDLIGCPFCLADMRVKNELNNELNDELNELKEGENES